MDWNNTKSIFIMVFFVLNIFLLYQFLEKINDYQLEYITEASTEDLLKEEEITYAALPMQKMDQFLIAKSKTFTKKETKTLKDQKADIIDGQKLVSTFENPISMSDEIKPAEVDSFLKDHILKGTDYRFWNYDKTNQTIVSYQVSNKKMFFNNSKGKVTLYLNKKGQVISYEQTYLEGIEKFNKPKELVSALNAISSLYSHGDIVSKDEVTKVELGFYNSLQTTSVSHLLVPTWRVVVNGETDLFVNAFDGEVIELNTEEKILE